MCSYDVVRVPGMGFATHMFLVREEKVNIPLYGQYVEVG
jgi:hypothetical protein